MSEQRHFIKAVQWVLFSFLLYSIVDTVSEIYPEYRPYGIAIVGAFVVFAVYKVRKGAKIL